MNPDSTRSLVQARAAFAGTLSLREVRALRGRGIVLILIALLTARTALCISAKQGIGWDFANYYATACRITKGEEKKLYHLSASRMDDFFAVTGEARQVSRKADGATVHSGRMGHIGFPLSAYLFTPLGLFPARQALVAFKLQSALFLAASLVLLYPPFRKVARQRLRADWVLPAYLLICLFYEPFWFVFATGGQATPLNLFLLVMFHRLYVQGNSGWAALFLSLGILIKPFFVLTLPIIALARDWRVLGALVGWLALEGAISVLMFGLQVHFDWLTVMRDAAGGIAEPWWNNSSVLGALYTLWCVTDHQSLVPAGEMRGPAQGAVLVYKLFIISLFAVLVRAAGRFPLESQQRRHNTVVLAVLFALCFSSIVWPHYLAFLFLPLLFLLFPAARLGRWGEVLIWLTLVSTLAVQSRFAQRYVLSFFGEFPYGQAVLAGLFGSCTMLLTLLFLLTCHARFLQAQGDQSLYE